MRTLLATLLLCLSAFAQQIDLSRNTKGILPRAKGGLGVGAINSYGGTIASASTIAVSCNQSLTVTGATTINTITMSPSVGCAAILVAGSGATWSTGTSGNISTAVTPAVGSAAILLSDGIKFNPGLAGASGTNGTGVLNGSGAPSGGTGVNGDFYIDTATTTLYGPKSAGVWGSGVSLIGPTGPSGVTVTLGALQFLQGKPDELTATQRAADLPYYLTSDYDFPAQVGGGALTGGAGGSAAFAPCPLGVAGTDANHYYWLEAGTGTAEAVLGTGGTCTPGAASGTIVFTPANNHGGAWTIGSASSGAREAILASNGNAHIKVPANATLLIAGANGLVIDKHNLTITGSGYGSVIQARANQALAALINVTDGDGLRVLNLTLDGNRSSSGTLPAGGTIIGCGQDSIGGCSHVVFQYLQIFHSTQTGIGIHDANKDILIENCWIHDNGGVLNGSGAGQGIFSYRASELDDPTVGLKINHNYIEENHNTVTNAGPSVGVAIQGEATITGNTFRNNYNNGGQVVFSHSSSCPGVISGNVITMDATALVQTTSGIESDCGGGLKISDNTITEHITGGGIALEGGVAGGASNTTITGNIIADNGSCISLNNAGGITRGTVISGNRLACPTGIYVDTATASTAVTGNDFSDSATPISDGSVDGIYLTGNFPMAANLVYGGAIASGTSVNMRCGQAATITGSTTISFIVLPAETAGGNGAGCMVSLIPAVAATWALAAGGNISVAQTGTPGVAIILVSDGTNFNPAGGSSLPALGPLEFLRGRANFSAQINQAASFPYLLASEFDFPAQQPGGSLTATVAASVTLTPCPLGVAGADANHYYRLVGGTGTAEPVLGTGGTCTSGAATGTLIFTPANSHSGAWTITSDSGGLREAILYSGSSGPRTILLDANRTILVSGSLGVVLDKDNLTLVGSGPSSVIKARNSAEVNNVVTASACNSCTLDNFLIDGNRANGGTIDPSGNGLGLGTTAVGGANHILVHRLEITRVAFSAIVVTDTNKDIEISSCYIHDNGGVTDAAGGAVGIFLYRSGSNTRTDATKILNNYFSHNHNTITSAGASSAIVTDATNTKILGNHFLDNYNVGGGSVLIGGIGSGPTLINDNQFVWETTALTEGTSGIEVQAQRTTISGNTFKGCVTGSAIALEGNSIAPSTIGASDTAITGNIIHCLGGSGIAVLNGGGVARGTIITGNRIQVDTGGGVGIFVDTDAKITQITGNNFSDSATPITDNSTTGVITSGNWPPTSNFSYAGTVASANTLNLRCNQSASITGAVTIKTITLPTDSASAGAQGLGQGCIVTLIPAAAATWVTDATGNIAIASTAVVGKALILSYDGATFFPSY